MTTLLPGAQIGGLERWTAKARSMLSAWPALPLRLVVGYGFMVHGYAKLSRAPETLATVLNTLGAPRSAVPFGVTTITELGGGFLTLTGAFVTITSGPLAIVGTVKGDRANGIAAHALLGFFCATSLVEARSSLRFLPCLPQASRLLRRSVAERERFSLKLN